MPTPVESFPSRKQPFDFPEILDGRTWVFTAEEMPKGRDGKPTKLATFRTKAQEAARGAGLRLATWVTEDSLHVQAYKVAKGDMDPGRVGD